MIKQELEMWMIFVITLLVLCQGRDDPCKATEGYSITLPGSITALKGFCVLIPCQFKLPPNCKMGPSSAHAIWLKGLTKNNVSKSEEKIKVLGDLHQQNCTTIIKNVKNNDATMYYFRVETNFKFTFQTKHLTLKVKDSPESPYVSGPSEVSEGSVVTLSCSAAAPCPYYPPTITWSLHTGNITTHIQDEGDGRRTLTSNLTFTASRSHHGREIFCMASWHKGNHSALGAKSLVQTLRVMFSPSIVKASVSPSGVVAEGSRVTLSCYSSEANPPVHNYTWYRDTQSSPVGSGPNITFNISSSDAGLYYCRAEHTQGAKESGRVEVRLYTDPLLEDSMMYVIVVGGCLGFLLLVVGTGISLRMTKSKVTEQDGGQNQGSNVHDQDDPADSNTPNPTKDQNQPHPHHHQQQQQGEDELHYGEISFSKTPQGGGGSSEGVGQQGQAQGSTQESEYAEVKLSGRDDQVRYQKAPDSEDLYAQVKR